MKVSRANPRAGAREALAHAARGAPRAPPRIGRPAEVSRSGY